MILQSVKDLPAPATRIVSLVPSLTELLWYLGLQDETVGITRFCVHPQEFRKTKAIVGGTKNVNLSKISELSPTLIIANKEENVKEQIEELATDLPVWLTP
jgi:ABC-type Fe3+-hydroxamate transport system substrate-binding protein